MRFNERLVFLCTFLVFCYTCHCIIIRRFKIFMSHKNARHNCCSISPLPVELEHHHFERGLANPAKYLYASQSPYRNPSPETLRRLAAVAGSRNSMSPSRKRRKMERGGESNHRRHHRKDKEGRERRRHESRSRSPMLSARRMSPVWQRLGPGLGRHYSRSPSRTRSSKRYINHFFFIVTYI